MPRGQRRRLQILAVAESLLLRDGFAETTMQRVAEAAGASKETLYRHFGSRDDLLIEIVLSRTARLQRQLDGNFESRNGLAVVLREVGINLLDAMTDPEVIPLLRIVVAETVGNPALGRALYTAGPERTNLQLAAYLEAARRRGDFRGEDPALAASLYIGSVLGNMLLFDLIRPPAGRMTRAQIEARVAEAVAVFTARYAPA